MNFAFKIRLRKKVFEDAGESVFRFFVVLGLVHLQVIEGNCQLVFLKRVHVQVGDAELLACRLLFLLVGVLRSH